MCDFSDASVGVYPLLKPSAADLGGGAVRAHITVITGSIPHTPLDPPPMEEEMKLSSSREEEENRVPLTIQFPAEDCTVSNRQHTISSSTVMTSDNTFSAIVSVERAMHLSLKGKLYSRNKNALHSVLLTYKS